MRSLWKGSITFGLVNIPVRLYAATEDRDVHFHLLHRPCHTPIRYQRYCPHCHENVPPEDIVRAYEWGRDVYVPVEEEELEKLPPAAQHTIRILDFVQLADIDPVYFDRPYYLEPMDGAEKPYALLRGAMREAQRVALAQVAFRQKEHLASVRVFRDRVLVMDTMHYPDEVRDPTGLHGVNEEPAVDPRELELAHTLIARLSVPFAPERYHDRYREALLELVQAKARGEKWQLPQPEEPVGVESLLEALRESVRMAETGARG
ncbi:MAG TPA: Ku protein [Firmicutes bacterium]|nr:Ku protein [Bacillota bacterium]